MEIKSSLLNYKEFNHLKDSIIKISSIDGKDKFRVRLVEYINDTSDNNDDMFFYEMLEFVKLDNSGFADYLMDIAVTLCKQKEESLYLADFLDKYSNSYYRKLAGKIFGTV